MLAYGYIYITHEYQNMVVVSESGHLIKDTNNINKTTCIKNTKHNYMYVHDYIHGYNI